MTHEQKVLIRELLYGEIDCISSILEHKEYADDTEKVELEERLQLVEGCQVAIL